MNKKIAVYDISNIVNWFLHKEPITHKKLQKLLYFSYGIYLSEHNNNENQLENFLFDNRFEAWVHGPVDPLVYSIYKNCGINLIFVEQFDEKVLCKEVIEVLKKTWDKYSNYSPDELEYITHNQSPWINARKGLLPWQPSNNSISDKDIFLTFCGE